MLPFLLLQFQFQKIFRYSQLMLLTLSSLLLAKPKIKPLVQFTSGYGSQSPFLGTPQVHKNEILAALADGNWHGLTKPGGGWKLIQANSKGKFTGPECDGGWIDLNYNSPVNQTVLLDAQGDSFGEINRIPVVGNVYESGYGMIPVQLRKGNNDFLFRCVRGEFSCQLLPLGTPIALEATDTTLPDFFPHAPTLMPGSLIVSNGTDRTQNHLEIECRQGHFHTTTKVDPVLPDGVIKAGFVINSQHSPHLDLRLIRNGKVLSELHLNIDVRKKFQSYKETFYSAIDGSVQYYAVNPSWNPNAKGLALSLHGAGVEAIGQANAYSQKPWANIVCPTNRRPFGFDWEDWGRIDALEVLHRAEKQLHPNPSEIYLVGHSMGGHGTIINGALYPGMFAAIAPSAGWISAETYAGYTPIKHPTGLAAVLQRASMLDNTLLFLHNYKSQAIYLLQGGADGNVPPSEETHLAALLSKFNKDYIFNLVPKMHHWWDIDPEPGADCVDLAALWDFLAEHRLPSMASMHHIDFTTSDPEVSAQSYWATIEQQLVPIKVSRVKLYVQPYLRRISGTTENVLTLKLNLAPLAPRAISGNKNLTLDLDGQSLTIPNVRVKSSVTVSRRNGKWNVVPDNLGMEKNPSRYGPVRLGFQHRFIYVYGTHGTPAENAWAIAKTRFDEESWWYRANGEFLAIPDTEFSSSKYPNRSVILIGNAKTNSAWTGLLGKSPIQVSEGYAKVGTQEWTGNSVSGIWLYPRPGSRRASVIAITGSGLNGMRGTDLLNYLQPMTSYPDYLLFNQNALTPHTSSGLLAAGFFDQNWHIAP